MAARKLVDRAAAHAKIADLARAQGFSKLQRLSTLQSGLWFDAMRHCKI